MNSPIVSQTDTPLAHSGSARAAEQPVKRDTVAFILVALACVVAAWLRLDGAADQIVMDDEYHTIEAALKHDYAYLNSHYHATDYCIPLALWDRLLINSIGLDEWGLRAPVLLCGIAIVPIGASLAWRCISPTCAVVTAWYFALSPMFLLYSRFARPYMCIAFLSLGAFWAWHRFATSGHWRWGLLSGAAMSLIPYFNISAAPAVAVFWATWILWSAFRVRCGADGQRVRILAAVGIRSLICVTLSIGIAGLLLWPGLESLHALVKSKSGGNPPDATTFWNSLQVVFGTRKTWIWIPQIGFAIAGAALLCARSAWLSALLLLMIIAEAVGIRLSAPPLIEQKIVTARYSIAAVPGLLILIAMGLGWVTGYVRMLLRRWPTVANVIVYSILAATLGILFHDTRAIAAFLRPNAFTNHTFNYEWPHWFVDRDAISPFYRYLADSPSKAAIVEAPYIKQFGRNYYAHLQKEHRKPVRVLSNDPLFRAPGIRFKSVIPLKGLNTSYQDCDYLVLHRNPRKEWYALTTRYAGRKRRSPPDEATYRRNAESVLNEVHADPRLKFVHQDDWITVFAINEAAEKNWMAFLQRTQGAIP